MQTTSADYKLEIKKPSRSFECKVTIGNNIYINEDIVDIILDTIQPNEGYSIGNATSQSLELTLINKGDIIYSASQIKLEIGLRVGSAIEYILMGYYNIDDVEKTDYTTKITAFDNMIKFETSYFSSLGDTATLQQIVDELVSKTGVQFTGSLPAYTVKKLEGFTCREVLGYVASLCGGNAHITRDGKFTIIVPKEVNYSITGDNYFDYKREEVKYKIGKISCKAEDKEFTKGTLGTDSMELQFENPWVTEAILTDIYNKLNGFSYLGYSMKWQGDLSLDAGDIVSVTDIKGVLRKVPILSQKFTYTGGLTCEIGAKGESKNKNSFNSSGSGSNKVDRVVTELLLVKEALIDKANIQDLEAVIIRTQKLEVETAKISKLEADVASINTLVAGKADIANLEAVDAKITQLKAEVAYVGDLEAANAKINDLTAKKANITDLNATNATVNNLKAEVAKIGKLEVDIAAVNKLVANKADITDLNAANAKIESLQSGKADIGQLNAANANIQTLLAHKATIEELIAGNISAENIAAGTITADSAIVASLNASKITTGTLDAKKVTVTNLNAASITAGTIDASKVNVTNINASNINTGTLDASKVTVSNVNAGSIIGGTLDAAKVTVRNLSASVITTGTLNAASVNITNLNATNITTGNLDCNRVNIKNLRADSIVAGSITVQGENLQKNSDFSAGFKNWNKTSGEMFIIQDSTILTDVKICMFRRTGLTSNSSAVMYSGSKAIKAIPGETFIASAYIFVQGNYTPMDADCSVSIWFYDKEGTYLKGTGTAFNNVVKGEWTRWYHTATAPANTAYVAMGVAATRNGQFAWAKPMLSKGTIASEWKPHTDELISSGAIDNDKLAGDSVTSDKLVLDEIFASEAFVTKFEAVEIKAAQITTGKIASEFLDIEGIISFKKNQNAFGEDMADNFIFDTTADKTFINGGAIYANSVTAEKINAKGLKIANAGNAVTFQVFDKQSADNSGGKYQEGDVIITGTMESTNYDPAANTGYRIGKDGNVDIFNANIRGDVILPQAGITNFGEVTGNPNIAIGTNNGISGWSWTLQTGGRSITEIVEDGIRCVKFTRDSVASTGWQYIGYSNINRGSYKPSTTYTLSVEVKCSISTKVSCTIRSGNGLNAMTNTSVSDFTQVNTWEKLVFNLTTVGTFPSATDQLFYFGEMNSSTGVTYCFRNLKIEEGSAATPWCPNKADAAALNPVRFWAGTDFDKRDEAPFQVLQDGTVKATRGEFGGTFTGELSIGNIRIADTNESEATITVHTNNNAKKVLEFNEQIAFIGTNLKLGAENAPSLEFDSTSRTFNFTKSAVHIVGNKSKVSFPADNSATIMKAGYVASSGYFECVDYFRSGTYVKEHNGVVEDGAPDFEFKRAQGDTTVKVNGAVDVTNEVVVGSVKIVNRSKNGKKRIDFVVV